MRQSELTNTERLQERLNQHKNDRLRHKQQLKLFLTAARTGDRSGFAAAYRSISKLNTFKAALTALAKQGPAHDEIRNCFVETWINSGDSLRDEAQSDVKLVDGLRCLLPAYHGPGLELFRGCTWHNRKRRTYGMSWSSSREVGEHFAAVSQAQLEEGSVLLAAYAPADAIIFAPAQMNNEYSEFEYVVDRRRLKNIRLLERYSGLTEKLRAVD